jgi:hypothetical protein
MWVVKFVNVVEDQLDAAGVIALHFCVTPFPHITWVFLELQGIVAVVLISGINQGVGYSDQRASILCAGWTSDLYTKWSPR